MKQSKIDMKRLKVVTVVGTRPEIIRLSATIRELDAHFNHVLVHTGQNYDKQLSDVFFSELNLRQPDYFLGAAGDGPIDTVASILKAVDGVLEKEQPDAFLVLGDTNSALSVYAAKRRKIPIFHMEAGNRSFDERVPEEVNRRIVDHTSDINMVYSDIQRQYLLREGMAPDRIIKTGSPMFEVLRGAEKNIQKSKILQTLTLTPRSYFVASFHREENVDSEASLRKLVETLRLVAGEYKKPIILSTHPRTAKRLKEYGIELPKEVRSLTPLGFHDYVRLQKDAFCVLSDSGTINEEASIIGFPAVTMREAHERQEAMDEAVVSMTGTDPRTVLQAVATAVSYSYGAQGDFRVPVEYAIPNVSKKVVRIIESYIDYVNRRVWYKESRP